MRRIAILLLLSVFSTPLFAEFKQLATRTSARSQDQCNEIAKQAKASLKSIFKIEDVLVRCAFVKDADHGDEVWALDIAYSGLDDLSLAVGNDSGRLPFSLVVQTHDYAVAHEIFDHANKTVDYETRAHTFEFPYEEHLEMKTIEECDEWARNNPPKHYQAFPSRDELAFGYWTHGFELSIARYCWMNPDAEGGPEESIEYRDIVVTARVVPKAKSQRAALAPISKETKKSVKSEITRFAAVLTTKEECTRELSNLRKYYVERFGTNDLILECDEYTNLVMNKKIGVVSVWNNVGIDQNNVGDKQFLQSNPVQLNHEVCVGDTLTFHETVPAVVGNQLKYSERQSFAPEFGQTYWVSLELCLSSPVEPQLNLWSWIMGGGSAYARCSYDENDRIAQRYLDVLTPKGATPLAVTSFDDVRAFYSLLPTCQGPTPPKNKD